mgnify:CR=1 FL=1
MDSFGCPDNFFIRGVQLAVTDVIFDGAGKEEIVLQAGIETLLKGRTSFVVAHRLSTIQKADRIFYIDDGKIIEQGSPAELMKKKGAYYQLYMAQFHCS